MTSTLSETLSAKKSEHRCLGRVNTYVLELKQIKRDEIEVRWDGAWHQPKGIAEWVSHRASVSG
jgi:hypothetical protein